MSRILVAMSGGVDSSVAAAYLKEQGYEPEGITMKLYDSADPENELPYTCCSENDIRDAMGVCAMLNIPYSVCDFRMNFREKVIDPFVKMYSEGRTPNPCIDCNRYLKFGALMEKAEELGCPKFATGHFARISKDPETGDWLLMKALHPEKDQSYVLYGLDQKTLGRVLFPLGDLTKEEVRNMAEKYGLSNASKHDSQDLCFVNKDGYAAFMENYTGHKLREGNFIDENGNILGKHRGIGAYTIGQRKGLGISADAPLYVKEIRPQTNEIVLSGEDALYSASCFVPSFNWITGKAPCSPLKCTAKTRYTAKETPATIFPESEGARVVFDIPQRAVTPGQSLVAYQGDLVLGGGVILPGGLDYDQ